MRTLLPILLLSLSVACGVGRHTVHADAPQSWFRITLGVTDSTPADWSGTIALAGGRLAALHSVRFDKDDKLDPAAGSWVCHTRRFVMADPRDWFVGAKHVLPTNLQPVQGAMIPNVIVVGFEAGSEARLRTAQGEARFTLADIHFGNPVKLLAGRVSVERVPQPVNLTSGDGLEDDQPAVSVDAAGQAWVAWIAYRAEKETLMVAHPDGSALRSIAQGEFSHPAMAGGTLAVSVRSGDTWKIAVSRLQDNHWSALDSLTSGGPDLYPAAALDHAGNPWIAWQGFRDGRSRILSRHFDGKSWTPETTISQNTADAWMPSLAAATNGAMHFAWDAYDDGVFNVYYRAPTGRMRRVLASRNFRANASVACDRQGNVWLAWDEAPPNWGKDTGFLVRERRGTALYEERSARLVSLDLRFQEVIPGGPEQPKLLAAGEGGLLLLMRRRNLKNQAVFSPSLQRDRVQQQSLWDYAVAALGSTGWSAPVPLPLSDGRNEMRAAFAALPGGSVLAAWNADGRTFLAPYPYIKNDIATAEIALEAKGTPTLSKEAVKPVAAVAPVHPDEAAQVARMRSQRIGRLLVLRGDMHRHTDISFDGDLDGGIVEFYRYMIDAANMDYGALTDHHAGDNKEFFWWILQKAAKMYYYPERFTPLFAYERSLRFPNGHRNLIWSKEGVHALATTPAEEAGTEGAGRLYAYLRQSGGLAMSHTSTTLMGTDWRDNDPQLEPLVEIYQGDRTSAEYEGAPRAARGNDPNTQPGGYKPAGFVWNAWAKGYKLGVQSSSDHSSTHISYAVVLAEGRTRQQILQAIAARHAYAATDNIVLDVRSGDHLQGDIFHQSEKPRLTLRIEGTSPISKVEVIRNNQFVFTNEPKRAQVTLQYEDSDPKPGESWYYVRVQQANGQMAWSSPIWIRR